MKMKFVSAAGAAAIVAAALLPQTAVADGMPKSLSWTAYGTTSSGYAQSVGLGQMLQKKYGTDLRIIPGKNDVSRMAPLKAGQAEICACGIAAYFGQEGVFMFADKDWGPLRVFNLFNNIGRNGQSIVVAADAGVKVPADLKGKRVTWVKGAPALNTNASAFLAFAGLTWNDVVKVEVPGWKQSADAVINGQADATWGSTVSSAYNQLAASPRKLFWPTLPHSDKAAWERAWKVAPHWQQTMVSNAIDAKNNTSGNVPFEGNNYPYPIFVAMPNVTDDLAYNLTKAVMENYDDFKEAGPGMDGYQLKNQDLDWIFPYHKGAIKYFKEKGVWTAEHDKHNAQMLKRQDVLEAAWKEMKSKKVDDDKFEQEWMKIRAAHLEKAGMPIPFN